MPISPLRLDLREEGGLDLTAKSGGARPRLKLVLGGAALDATGETREKGDLSYVYRNSDHHLSREIAIYGELPPEHPLMRKLESLYAKLDLKPEERVRIHVIPGRKTINAMALCNGHMVFNMGSFEELPPFEEVWLALIAHEQMHLSAEHTRKSIERSQESERVGTGHILEDVAEGRLNEMQADLEGSVQLLNRSGINPLGAKLLFQKLSEGQKRGWHNVTHGTALDRMLNVESLFGVYDFGALSDKLTKVEMSPADLDSDRCDSTADLRKTDFSKLKKEKIEIQERRLALAKGMGLEESVLWMDYYMGVSSKDEYNEEVMRVLDSNIDCYLGAEFADFDSQMQKGMKWFLFEMAIFNFELPKLVRLGLVKKSSKIHRDFVEELEKGFEAMGLDGLKKWLRSDAWARFKGVHCIQFPQKLIYSIVEKAKKDGVLDVSSAENIKAFKGEWVKDILCFYGNFGINDWDEEGLSGWFDLLIGRVNDFSALKGADLERVDRLRNLVGAFVNLDTIGGGDHRVDSEEDDCSENPDEHYRLVRGAGITPAIMAEFRNFVRGLDDEQVANLIRATLDKKRAENLERVNKDDRLKTRIEKEYALSELDWKVFNLESILNGLMANYFKWGTGVNGVSEDLSKVILCDPGVLAISSAGVFWGDERMAACFELDDYQSTRSLSLLRKSEFVSRMVAASAGVSVQAYQLFFKSVNALMGRMTSDIEPGQILQWFSEIDETRAAAFKMRGQAYPKDKQYHANDHGEALKKKILCQYLGSLVGNKEKLFRAWKELKGTVKVLEILGEPSFESALDRMLFVLFDRGAWDLENPEDCLFLIDMSSFVRSPEVRMSLYTLLVDRYLGKATFEEKLDFLFGEKGEMIRDFKLQDQFIEDESKTHDEIRNVREGIQKIWTSALKSPPAGVGVMSLLEGLSLSQNSSESLFKLLMGTERDDRQIKEFFFENIRSRIDLRDDDEFIVEDKVSEIREMVYKTDMILSQLFNMPASMRYMLSRSLLVGPGGILFNKELKKGMFKTLMGTILKEKENEADVRKTLQEVTDAICEIQDWKEVFFAMTPLVTRNIALTPKKTIPWSDIYMIEEILDKPYREKRGNQYDPKNLKVSKDLVSRASLSAVDKFIEGKQEKREEREKLSPLGLVVEVAKHLGAPAVRFLQVLGQYFQVPPEYQREFDAVYDGVHGQNKVFADMLLEREWPGFREETKGLEKTVGGGSIMTVFKVGSEVVKVRNPNILYRMELAFDFMAKIVQKLIEKDPKKYGPLELALDDIRQWIRFDITDEDYLEKDREFRKLHDGYQPEDYSYRIRVPESRAPSSEFFKREEFVDGENLTQWESLKQGKHSMKEVISLIAKHYFHQLMTPANGGNVRRVHADVHPGNFRVDSEKNVWILDRNGYQDYSERDIQFLWTLQAQANAEGVAQIFSEYLSDKYPAEETKRIVTETLQGKEFGFGAIQELLCALRSHGIRIPLNITILLKNINSLNRLSQKAGFAEGLPEALAYEPDRK